MTPKTQKMRVALTGAYGGIGSALAMQLYAAGADLYLIGRDAQKLEALKVKLRAVQRAKRQTKSGEAVDHDQRVELLVADLTDSVQLDRLVRQLSDLPPINVLVNNAGISHFGLFEDTTDEALTALISTNVTAVMQLTQRLLPMLRAQKHARIINVGSVFGSLAYPGFVAYSASKFALKGFSEALSRELANTGVSVGHFSARATNTTFNSSAVVALNNALKTHTDSPHEVAAKLTKFIHSRKLYNAIPWPEKMFVRLNAVLPSAVSTSLQKQLPIIEQFAKG